MKAPMMKALAALYAAATVGSAFAAAGYSHPTEGWVSSNKTRAEVMEELKDAHAQGLSITSMRDGEDAAMGAHGPAGSRYSMRTREEVQAELANQKTDDAAALQKSLYFGD